MKLRQVTSSRSVTQTIDGEDVTYDEPYTEMIPKIPFNLDAALRKALFAVAVLMTAGAIVWGTVAIGSMLALLAPQWAAYLVAGCFDLAWAACLAAEYINRYDAEKAKLPRDAGIAALALSMGAIMWHGNIEGALVVGIVGAAVSLVSKGVWFIAMQAVTVKLDKPHQMLLRKRQQDAGLKLALAQSRRDQIITDDRTARLLASMEYSRGQVHKVQAVRADQATDHVAEQLGQAPDLRMVQSEPSTDQATARHLDPADQVSVLVDLLKSGQKVTKRSAAVTLGTSETTAQRRLTEAKARLDDGTGQYL